MKKRNHTLSQIVLRGIFTLLIGGLSLVSYGQQSAPAAPAFKSAQEFCSDAAWAKIGEDGSVLSDLPIYVSDTSYTVKWYTDAGLTKPVTRPDTLGLTDGDVFYVTQTDDTGAESKALKVKVSEKDCGCIKNPTFETQQGKPNEEGYNGFVFDGIDNHKTCSQSMFGAPAHPFGNVNADDRIELVSAGSDQNINNMTRTNPNNALSRYALRVNTSETSANISSVSKKIIAGEVFSFKFNMVLENPSGHDHEEMPFAQVNIYDMQGNLLQSRCMVSDINDCIFIPFNNGEALYSGWTCLKMNTASYIGQPLRVEFITSWCELTAHYGYMYVDDLYAGEDYAGLCSNSAFGFAKISDISPAGNNCFIPAVQKNFAGCAPGMASNIPGFPLLIEGEYDAPISQGNPPSVDDITLDIIQNGTIVGSVSAAQPGATPGTFQFTITQADINVPPYGDFKFKVLADFAMDCGVPYSYKINSNAESSLLPTSSCPITLSACDDSGDGFGEFNLTQHGDLFYGTQWTAKDVDVTYYRTVQDAQNKTNPIQKIKKFKNTDAYFQTVYMRLEWKVKGLPKNSYYIMPLDMEIVKIPELRQWEEESIYCNNSPIHQELQGTPLNLTDLEYDVSYAWYKDGEQLPYSGGIYEATESGKYTVVVSNGNCEVSQSIEIKQINIAVDLGDEAVHLCNKGEYKIEPNLQSTGSADIDFSEAQYTWSTGETTRSIEVTETGTYSLTVTYSGCSYSDDIFVNLATKPAIAQVPDFHLCYGDTRDIVLDISHPDMQNVHIEWYRDGGLIAQDINQIQITEDGVYKVVAGQNDAFDFCTRVMSFDVEYYDNKNCVVPEGLSPNGDGLNDNLDLRFLDDQHGIAEIQIYNRYGAKVYSKTNYTNQWHGQSDNGKLPTGTYYYIVKLKDGTQSLKGYIYLNY